MCILIIIIINPEAQLDDIHLAVGRPDPSGTNDKQLHNIACIYIYILYMYIGLREATRAQSPCYDYPDTKIA